MTSAERLRGASCSCLLAVSSRGKEEDDDDEEEEEKEKVAEERRRIYMGITAMISIVVGEIPSTLAVVSIIDF